jgi:hypothetical protein
LFSCISEKEGIHPAQLFLLQDAKIIHSLSQVNSNSILQVRLKGNIKGGKGGFGSLLRSMNPKKKPTDNFEACRDLTGRRLRNVNNE